MKNIIVYGDIHGCLDELKKLRKKIALSPDDIEVSVGDFFNKGPHSVETLHYLLDENIKMILGNNEVKVLKMYRRYKKDGKKYLKTLRDFEKNTVLTVTETEISYLKNLPYFLRFYNLTIVHGGILPNTKLSEKLDKNTKKDVTLARYLNKDLETIPWNDIEGRYKFWSEVYDGREGFVIYGHQPFDKPKIDEFSIGIDTGCVYDGKLTAIKIPIDDEAKKVLIDEYELISVKAMKNYWK